MSREMKHFADYFMQGMQMGMHSAEKWQAGQIAKARDKLRAEAAAVREAREERKLGIYAEGVRANAEAARARAYRTMNPIAKGGKAAGPSTDADTEALRKEAAERGIIGAPLTPPSNGGTTNVTVEAPEPDPAPVPQPPAAAPVVEEDSRGGMVGSKRYAEGGIVSGGGMGLEEARDYGVGIGGPSPRKASKPAANPFNSAMGAAAAKYKTPEEKKKPDVDVRPTGPQGSGPGGSYTPADTGPGGVISTNYRAGGAVQHDSGAWYAEGGKVRYASNEDRLIEPQATSGMAEIPVGRGRLSLGANYDPNSRYGRAEAGYEHPVGRNTTLGVRGDIGKDLGPEGASARPDWGVGVRGRIKFQDGGQVTRFQSGGRVMREQAIDTGTTGPMSGYGYRAAPPANARRR